MSKVFIHKDSIDDFALAHQSSRDLLYFSISFDLSIELINIEGSLKHNLAGSVSQVHNHLSPVFGKFGSHAGLEHFLNIFLI